MPSRPQYAVESVDSALRLLLALQRDGVLRVSSAATELGVAKSTAHRLIAMLEYRGFVVRAEDRSYRPGPAVGGAVERSGDDEQALVDTARPYLVALSRRVDESVNLLVLRGAEAHFLDTAECAQALRVGSRAGTTMPARVTSGGLALLAALGREEVERLHPALAGTSGLASLLSQLTTTRRLGYGVNYEASEVGVTAVGMAVRDRTGHPVCAVSVAAPTARVRKGQITRLLPALRECREQIEDALSR